MTPEKRHVGIFCVPGKLIGFNLNFHKGGRPNNFYYNIWDFGGQNQMWNVTLNFITKCKILEVITTRNVSICFMQNYKHIIIKIKNHQARLVSEVLEYNSNLLQNVSSSFDQPRHISLQVRTYSCTTCFHMLSRNSLSSPHTGIVL